MVSIYSLPEFLFYEIVSFVDMNDRLNLFESGIWGKEICFWDFGDYSVLEFVLLQYELEQTFLEFYKPRDEGYDEMVKKGICGYDMNRRFYDMKESKKALASSVNNSNEPMWLEDDECIALLRIVFQTVVYDGHLPVAKLFAEKYVSKLSYGPVVVVMEQLVKNNQAKIFKLFISSVHKEYLEENDDLWKSIMDCEVINDEIVKALSKRSYGVDPDNQCFEVLARLYAEKRFDLLKYILDNADYQHAKEFKYSALLAAIPEDGFFRWFSDNIKDEYRQILPEALENGKSQFDDEMYLDYHALVKKYFGC